MRNGPIINGGKAFAPSSHGVGGSELPGDALGQSVRVLGALALGSALAPLGPLAVSGSGPVMPSLCVTVDRRSVWGSYTRTAD